MKNPDNDWYSELYGRLCMEVQTGVNTIEDELKKPKEQQDVAYMLGQTEFNACLSVAIEAMERFNLTGEDDEEHVCPDCEEKHGSEKADVEKKTDPQKMN